ncbi:uncharacterized protein LY89DRAFT_713798 [Mollisia scopiformis]|uniref:Uncharacterized protein n=1 Tax=Mollisia scopiformis TaxID=149040 RepID=A0A194XSY6_MOLSC|nr:uncharacterized protein LY89DRAFT_713798 [Mollisia scopiformis]KUJ23308.1 hypothetical protein LY89DRAFT_713798 [Mollisia scopiformis]
MAIEEIDHLQKELNDLAKKLNETIKVVELLRAQRKEVYEKLGNAAATVQEATRINRATEKKLARAQKSLTQAEGEAKVANERFVKEEDAIEKLRAEENRLKNKTEDEVRHEKVHKKMLEIKAKVEYLNQDRMNWASWPPEELVRRWENGDIYYEPFTKEHNVLKLSSAYQQMGLPSIPSDLELTAISSILHNEKGSTPWKCKFWNPECAAFPDPSQISINTDGSSSSESIVGKTTGAQSPSPMPIKSEVNQSDSIGPNPQIPMKTEDNDTVLGKRNRETSASSTATASSSSSGQLAVEANVGVDNSVKSEVGEERAAKKVKMDNPISTAPLAPRLETSTDDPEERSAQGERLELSTDAANDSALPDWCSGFTKQNMEKI